MRFFRRENPIQHHLMLPVIAEIILVFERIAFALKHRGNRCFPLIDQVELIELIPLGHSPILAVFLELMEVAIGPTHRDLDSAVKATEAERSTNFKSPPNRGVDVEEGHLELVNKRLRFSLEHGNIVAEVLPKSRARAARSAQTLAFWNAKKKTTTPLNEQMLLRRSRPNGRHPKPNSNLPSPPTPARRQWRSNQTLYQLARPPLAIAVAQGTTCALSVKKESYVPWVAHYPTALVRKFSMNADLTKEVFRRRREME